MSIGANNSEHLATSRRNPKLERLGVGDTLGEGDSSLVLEVLPRDLAATAFDNMRKEVAWNTMYHRGAFPIVPEDQRFAHYILVSSRGRGSQTCSS